MVAVKFSSLADCSSRNDHEGFLRSYMQLVIAGKNLVVPTTLDYKQSKAAWQEILFGVPGGDSETFLVNLTNLWLRLLKKHGGQITPNFAREILDILDNKAVPTAKAMSALSDDEKAGDRSAALAAATGGADAVVPKISPIKAVTQEERRREARPNLNGVEGSITKDYFDDAVVQKLMKDDGTTDARIEESFKSNEVDNFLIYYLKQQIASTRPKVPLSSVPDVIFHSWSDILIDRFDELASPDFLRKLSSRWFYLVNQKGLPSTRQKMVMLLQFLIKDVKSAESGGATGKKNTPTKKKGGLLDTLNKLFS